MSREFKNTDYNDVIFFTLGEIEEKEKNIPQALTYYNLSVRKSVSNPNQKALSFLKMAEINFDLTNYQPAEAYYDSTMQFLDTRHEAYDDLKIKTDNLSGLVEHLEAIATQDSLQMVAAMPDKQRSRFIGEIIEQVKRDEESAKIAEQQRQRYIPDQNDINRSKSRGSTFYFYNPSKKINSFQIIISIYVLVGNYNID